MHALRNMAIAMEFLKSKLYRLEMKRRHDMIKEAKSVIRDNSWSNQIRTYTLHPYRLVKDARSGAEANDPENVLNGEDQLDSILKESLLKLSDS